MAGKNITDNIILAQEVIHYMRCKHNGRNWMAIKLNLEKAYDRVSWGFIGASLVATGIPKFLRKVIMTTIYSSSIQVIWNGVLTQKFKLAQEIRQGCPLSSCLFVLCMKWLNHIICQEIKIGKWRPTQLSRIGPAISHLFFADDLVIFCKLSLIKPNYWKAFCIFANFWSIKSILGKVIFIFLKGLKTKFAVELHKCSTFRKFRTLVRIQESLSYMIGLLIVLWVLLLKR